MKKFLLSLVAMLAASAPASANFPKDTQAWPGYNLIGDLNPGFENGTTQWTASAGTFTTSTSIFMEGLRAAQWTPAASGNTLASPSATLGSGISQAGRNGVGSCAVRAQDGATLEVIDGSSNIIASVAIPGSTTAFQRGVTNFVFPNAGGASVKVRVKSLGTNVVYVDSCYVGPAEGFNLSQVSQAQIIAAGFFATTASCTWTRTNTAIGAFGTVAACPAPTFEFSSLGTWSTADTDLPQISATNLPPGRYKVTYFLASQGDSATKRYLTVAVSDGTTTSGTSGMYADNTLAWEMAASGTFEYTSAGSRTFALNGASSSGTINVDNANGNNRVRFIVEYWPSASQLAVAANLSPAWAGISVASSGFANSSTSTWQNANAAGFATKTFYGSATAPGTANDLAFTVPSLPAGTYEVCTNVRIVSEQGQSCYAGITDGTTRFMVTRADVNNAGASYQDSTVIGCGLISYSTVQTNRTFTVQSQSVGATASRCSISTSNIDSLQQSWITIKPISQNLPVPVLVGSVTSGSTGAFRIESAKLTSTPSTCTVTSSSSSWIGSGVYNATGDCSYTITSGLFSAAPVCVSTADIYESRISVLTATSIRIHSALSNGTGTDGTQYLICMGPR